ncbi:M28 family peptidase [Chitinophaga sp. SYP-B3965]|uniref:M28 family peptidase n=1 Tax=Chitinophaga sp. SYP-B3965 TaxID=2663120 RepID=UPI001299A65E|nr:M28 family peptidase [Chitinophaga sp. SYP-B3965]MRG46519.1 M28 family peptidase [Chitinophaga sp. SYP-B3965]
MKIFLPIVGCLISLSTYAQIDSSQLMKDVQTLSADKMEGRKTGTKGNRLAQFYLLDRLKQTGLQQFSNTYEQPFYFTQGDKRIMGTNLYGYIKGSTDSFIVISAHYDHIGTKKPQTGTDSIYNGADDNASGIGGMLAMAQYFSKNPPKHTLIFAAFDAEEMGLQGAKAFVAKLPVPATRILMNINMDMISRNDKNELYVCGTALYPQLKPFVTAAAATSTVKLPMGHDRPEDKDQNWTNQSDHYEFHKKKIPFLYFGVEDHPDYHKASDEFSRINPSFYYQATKAVLNIVQIIDKQ